MNPFASQTPNLTATWNPIAASGVGPTYSGNGGTNGSAVTSLITVNDGSVGSLGIYALIAAALVGLFLILRA